MSTLFLDKEKLQDLVQNLTVVKATSEVVFNDLRSCLVDFSEKAQKGLYENYHSIQDHNLMRDLDVISSLPDYTETLINAINEVIKRT
ncbi:MAG: hypothetical protein WKF68_02520 [Daejeonella sp.]